MDWYFSNVFDAVYSHCRNWIDILARCVAFAILMAFHVTGDRHSMTQDQICRAAQPFCDEVMESNFNAGRLYGAWKSHETLKRHGFLCVEKAGVAYGARGFRSLGKNSYSLTRQGELFIEALFKYKPELRRQILQTKASPLGGDRGAATFDGDVAHNFGNIVTPSKIRSSSAARGGNADDNRRLKEFAAQAQAGDTIKFDVPKERRNSLHRLTDILSPSMEGRGLCLTHESRGAGRARAITIRADRMPAGAAAFSTPTKRLASALDTTPELSDDEASITTITGVGKSLTKEYGTPPKRSRALPAQEAAREAALLRQAIFLSTQDAKQPKDGPESAKLRKTIFEQAHGAKNAKVGSADHPLSLDSDSDDEDKKPKALPSRTDHDQNPKSEANHLRISSVVEAHSRQSKATRFRKKSQAILDLLESDEDDDDLLRPIFKDQRKTAKDVEIVEITPRGISSSGPKKLQIFIDDRERSRNAQPRYLRMQLNQLLSSQIFKTVQPKLLIETEVVEKTLHVGDFGFHITLENGKEAMNLPVCIERKRIGDLVQRSAAKDHWRQLLRGQESSLANVLLLEGDFRSAQTYEAFGAGDLDEAWSPRRHVINDESTLLISLSRVILCIHNVRLIQTKDEQESLRSVAAYGTVAAFCSLSDSSKETPIFGRINDEKHRLADRLVDGGIPPGLAHAVSEEVGSMQALKRLYSMGESQECSDQLLVPLISSHCERHNQDAISWSKAIHTVVFSASSDISETKKTFIEHKHLVSDEAGLLVLLHQAKPIGQALDEMHSANDDEVRVISPRVVRIELSPDLKSCFPDGNVDGAFYRLREVNLLGIKLSRVRMWTETADFRSDYIDLNLMDGPLFVDIVIEEMVTTTRDCLAAARQAASRIHTKLSDRKTKNVLMIRGLRPALDRVAKGVGYRPETRLVVDMVCAELSITYGLILFQAVRKTGDMEAFVREFAFACFHYQLLTRKRPKVFP